MAEAFLSQLLRVENCVQEQPINSGSGECCSICLEKCGTICEKTGVVEYEVRLPCKHTVGSRCIATWLDPTGNAQNSCPICRHILFPAQSRPYLEHEIIGEDEGIRLDTPEELRARGYVVRHGWEDDEEVTEEDSEEDESNLEIIETMCETFCYRLSLTTHSRAIEISQLIAQHILEKTGVASRPDKIAAVIVFATSHLVGAPKTLEWVSMNSGVTVGAIAGMYGFFTHQYDFGEFIDEEMLAMIGRGDRETVLGLLPEAR